MVRTGEEERRRELSLTIWQQLLRDSFQVTQVVNERDLPELAFRDPGIYFWIFSFADAGRMCPWFVTRQHQFRFASNSSALLGVTTVQGTR